MKNSNINKTEIINKITPFIEKAAEDLGLIALEVDFVMEAGNWHLRIFIHSQEHSITHEDCEKITKSIDDKLDELIPVLYYMEVSSPGLEKKLKSSKEYNFFRDHKVNIKLKQAIDEDIKNMTAIIINYDAGILKVKQTETNNEYDLKENNISSIRLIADFSTDK